MTLRFLPLLLAGTVLSGLAFPALAGNEELLIAGDGSATDNRDLLRGSYECGYGCESGPPPSEPFHPPFDIDWSIALRGTYVQEGTTSRWETSLIPAVGFHHEGMRSTFDVDAEAEIIKPQDTVVRIGALRLSAASEYGLDEVTNFATDGTLTLTQAAPSDPSNAAGTLVAPRVTDADFAATLTRDIGIAYVGFRGTVGRTDYGDTTLNSGVLVDNSFSSNNRYGAGLRLSHRLTPVIAGFVDGSVEYRVYDAPSPTLLVPLDGTDYVGRIGLEAEIPEVLETEASVGVALRKFANTGLADVQAVLFDASVTFRPHETLELSGSIGTEVGAPGPNGTGTASIERIVAGEARYKVNTWWSVWAAAGWSRKTAVAAATEENSFNVGGGSEYRVNAHVSLTADYTFTHREVTGVAPVDTHKVTAGVKVQRLE